MDSSSSGDATQALQVLLWETNMGQWGNIALEIVAAAALEEVTRSGDTLG